jgi:hypothetical protein
MKTSEETDKIIPAMHQVHQSVSWAGKSSKNTYAHYSYASLEDCKEAYDAALNEAGLFITTSVFDTDCTPVDDGKHMMALSKITVRLWHTSGLGRQQREVHPQVDYERAEIWRDRITGYGPQRDARQG